MTDIDVDKDEALRILKILNDGMGRHPTTIKGQNGYWIVERVQYLFPGPRYVVEAEETDMVPPNPSALH